MRKVCLVEIRTSTLCSCCSICYTYTSMNRLLQRKNITLQLFRNFLFAFGFFFLQLFQMNQKLEFKQTNEFSLCGDFQPLTEEMRRHQIFYIFQGLNQTWKLFIGVVKMIRIFVCIFRSSYSRDIYRILKQFLSKSSVFVTLPRKIIIISFIYLINDFLILIYS